MTAQKIFFNGLNTTAKAAHRRTSANEWVAIHRGIYIDASLEPDERRDLIQRHALRIATKLYSNVTLTGSSALHAGAVDGYLAIATPWGGPQVQIGGAFEIYNGRVSSNAAFGGEYDHIAATDSIGDFLVRRHSDEMLIVRNFYVVPGRPRETLLTAADMVKVVERALQAVPGDTRAEKHEMLARRLKRIAEAQGLVAYGAKVDDLLRAHSSEPLTAARNYMQAFKVFWHGYPIATLGHDGAFWELIYQKGIDLRLGMNEKPHDAPLQVPNFLASLLPENPRLNGKDLEDRLGEFRVANRFVSNITVQPVEVANVKSVVHDILQGELGTYADDRLVFTGALSPELTGMLSNPDSYNDTQRNSDMPRISGIGAKVAAHLDASGNLMPATARSFTHILKIAGGTSDYSSMGSVEWFSMAVAKLCGLHVEEFAIVDMGARPPAIVVERFDVRKDLNDTRMILTEDFWSIQGMRKIEHKYKGDLITVGKWLRENSSDPDVDCRRLFEQAVVSWLMANSDMHLKNLMVIKEAKSVKEGFSSIRLSPAYDIMCTQVYPNDPPGAAIGINGAGYHSLHALLELGRAMRLPEDDVRFMLDELSASVVLWGHRLKEKLPEVIQKHAQSVAHIEHAVQIWAKRCFALRYELEQAAQAASTPAGDGDFEASPAVDTLDVQAHVSSEELRAQRHPDFMDVDDLPENLPPANPQRGLMPPPRPA